LEKPADKTGNRRKKPDFFTFLENML